MIQIRNLIIHVLKENESFMVFPRHLSKLDRERILKYVSMEYHFVRRNHGLKKKVILDTRFNVSASDMLAHDFIEEGKD